VVLTVGLDSAAATSLVSVYFYVEIGVVIVG